MMSMGTLVRQLLQHCLILSLLRCHSRLPWVFHHSLLFFYQQQDMFYWENGNNKGNDFELLTEDIGFIIAQTTESWIS